MNLLSRSLVGAFFILLGLILTIYSIFDQYITLIYGIPLLILGFFIFFNKKEDMIERRKDLNNSRSR